MMWIQYPRPMEVRDLFGDRIEIKWNGRVLADKDTPLDFFDLLRLGFLNQGQHFGANFDGVEALIGIGKALKGKQPGDWVALDDAWLYKLRAAFENPASPLLPHVYAAAKEHFYDGCLKQPLTDEQYKTSQVIT